MQKLWVTLLVGVVKMDTNFTYTERIKRVAEDINNLVISNKIDPKKDFPPLLEHGLDPEPIACWHTLYGKKIDTPGTCSKCKEHYPYTDAIGFECWGCRNGY